MSSSTTKSLSKSTEAIHVATKSLTKSSTKSREAIHVTTTCKRDMFQIVTMWFTKKCKIHYSKRKVMHSSRYKLCSCTKYKELKACKHINAVSKWKATNGKSNKSEWFQNVGKKMSLEKFILTRQDAMKLKDHLPDEVDDRMRKNGWKIKLITHPSAKSKIFAIQETKEKETNPFYIFKQNVFGILAMFTQNCPVNHDTPHELIMAILTYYRHQLKADFIFDWKDYELFQDIITDLNCQYIQCNEKLQKRCSGCGVGYCKKKHQKLDWNKNRHKEKCVKRAALIKKWTYKNRVCVYQ